MDGPQIRMTPGGGMEAIGKNGNWQQVPRDAQIEIEELRRRLGGGCEANSGGNHLVIRQVKYSFCQDCGETLHSKVTRYVHPAPTITQEEGE